MTEAAKPASVWAFVAALAVIAVVFLAVLAAISYVVYRRRHSNLRHAIRGGDRKRISRLAWLAVALVLVFVFGALVVAVLIGVIQVLERRKLFAPTKISRYRRVSGKWFPLPSGGGLLQVTPDCDPEARPVLFIHGNSGNLDLYSEALNRFASIGYNVYCLEMAGYGPTRGGPGTPSPDSVLQDTREAWAICGRADAILVGFSLGGAIVGQVYDEVDPLPAQIVLLNTMASIPALVAQKLGDTVGPVVAPIIRCQWHTKPPRRFRGRVVVVWTSDDDVVPAEHGAELCAIFSAAGLKPECIELPSGNHRWSALTYLSSWCSPDVLLPP